ncbi:hypothetical protein ACN38_g8361 [Penicillium nordicum]|uniref:Uncharacterized protein n=1 Tax=Penicillium nordicum TaxID=229535 RepID=A0A0M8P4X1_9EURO|nr:hypothetical protein ACN38_g8361 [Penicillium nordicum]
MKSHRQLGTGEMSKRQPRPRNQTIIYSSCVFATDYKKGGLLLSKSTKKNKVTSLTQHVIFHVIVTLREATRLLAQVTGTVSYA